MPYNILVVIVAASLLVNFGLAALGVVKLIEWCLRPGAVNRKWR